MYQVRTKFDRQTMQRSMDRSKAQALSKIGAFVRTASTRSIVKAKSPSRSGKPPHGHGQQLLRRKIFFGVDKANDSVAIGPINLNHVFFERDGQPVKGTVPSVLEKGGEIFVLEVFKWGRWRRADLRSKRRNAGLPTRLRKVRVEARPYMRPALDKERPKFAPLMRGTFKK